MPIIPKSMYASLQENKCHTVKSFEPGKAVYLAYTVCKAKSFSGVRGAQEKSWHRAYLPSAILNKLPGCGSEW